MLLMSDEGRLGKTRQHDALRAVSAPRNTRSDRRFTAYANPPICTVGTVSAFHRPSLDCRVAAPGFGGGAAARYSVAARSFVSVARADCVDRRRPRRGRARAARPRASFWHQVARRRPSSVPRTARSIAYGENRIACPVDRLRGSGPRKPNFDERRSSDHDRSGRNAASALTAPGGSERRLGLLGRRGNTTRGRPRAGRDVGERIRYRLARDAAAVSRLCRRFAEVGDSTLSSARRGVPAVFRNRRASRAVGGRVGILRSSPLDPGLSADIRRVARTVSADARSARRLIGPFGCFRL